MKRVTYRANDYNPVNSSYNISQNNESKLRRSDAQENSVRLDCVVDVLHYFQGLKTPSNMVY